MTRPSKREIETELAALGDTDDGTEIDEVHIVMQTERGFVDIETGELAEDGEVVADFTDART
jgi:hypothetical protein